MSLLPPDLVRELLTTINVEAAIVSYLPHIRHLTGFTGSNALLIVTREAATVFTDGRYDEQIRYEIKNPDITVEIAHGKLLDTAMNAKLVRDSSSIAIQGEHLTAADLQSLVSKFGPDSVVVTNAWLEPQLAAKDADALAAINKAQRITEEVFDEVPEIMAEGKSEKEIAAEITYRHLKRGAEKMSFDPIVAYGENSSRPHARPSDRTLQPNDVVLLDFGCFVDGYASDMTRMVVYGEPEAEFESVFEIVSQAKRRAIDAAEAGMRASDLDAVARTCITEAGYGPQFSHGLGHGVGLEIHEWPSISARNDSCLPDSIVITIEPGIYLSGKFGVRLEDMILVTRTGAAVITKASSDLVVIEPEHRR